MPCSSESYGVVRETDRDWHNWLGNVGDAVPVYFLPSTRQGLVWISIGESASLHWRIGHRVSALQSARVRHSLTSSPDRVTTLIPPALSCVLAHRIRSG
jgi:hypothetical protein